MRLPRAVLIERLSGPDAPLVVLLEAPSGYGKSWLARRLVGPDSFRVRNADELDDARRALLDGRPVLIDDADRLFGDEIDGLCELIEDADGAGRLYLTGRLLPDAVHSAAQLVDAGIADAATLAVTAPELAPELSDLATSTATRIVDAVDGCIRIVATVVDQLQREPNADPVSLAARLVRTAAVTAVQQLDERDAAVLGLLARAPGIQRIMLDKIAGAGFVERCVAAGVPIRRMLTGELDLAMAAAFRTGAVDADAATQLAEDLIDRDRPLEGVGLLLDAGLHDQAAASLMALSESITDTVEPRTLLGLLARLGTTTDREPALLLFRAAAARDIGQVDQSAADIDRAVALATERGSAVLRRRAEVEAARARLAEGKVVDAVRIAEQALVDLADGEDPTYARAYQVLAESAATSDSRVDLQRAAECYRVAAGAWEGCGEFARARSARCDLAVSVLVPLGRYDEALAQLSQLLSAMDMSDAERSWTMLMEAFVLYNANRLESAESRFLRVTDIGYLQDNPRLVASSAWGRALVAARRNDLEGTVRWIAAAENTALTDTDDVLGIPFLCDAATALGALGELELARRYLSRAIARRPLFPDQVRSTQFLLEARMGRLGDLDDAFRITPPAEWWRVYLIAALDHARRGDTDTARRLQAESQRELVALGLSDADTMGEYLTHEQLHTMLQRAPEAEPTPRLTTTTASRPAPEPARGRRLCVIGEPMVVYDGESTEVIPAGNPQRLVGVIVANGGAATVDQLSEAIWPGDEVETSRSRLRNVLMRLRRASGDVVVRSGSGVKLAQGLTCDLLEFEQLAADALASARVDPDLAGRLASDALAVGEGTVFVDFEYEEWAITARRAAEQRMIGLLDLLSVQAEDAGDLPAAQALAERALRLDRYTDSRYVRLAELLTMQQRVAAAIAVLDDAAEVAREMGGALPNTVLSRRNDLLRRAASS